jgi:hypothetical protein
MNKRSGDKPSLPSVVLDMIESGPWGDHNMEFIKYADECALVAYIAGLSEGKAAASARPSIVAPKVPECCYGGKLKESCVLRCAHVRPSLWPTFDALQSAPPSPLAATVTCEKCAFRYGEEHFEEGRECPVCELSALSHIEPKEPK